MLYPAGRYPTALVIGMAADRAISASDVTYMTTENYARVKYVIRTSEWYMKPCRLDMMRKVLSELGSVPLTS